MTNTRKTKLLKKLSKTNMARKQITDFCTDRPEDGESEIYNLCKEKSIDMISDPHLDHGVFVPKPDDLFGIADGGKDRLAEIRKERFRVYFPIVISILSLISLLCSVLCLLKVK